MARQWEALIAETESPTMAERAAAWRESERPEASAAAAELQSMPDSASQNGGRRLATAEDEMAHPTGAKPPKRVAESFREGLPPAPPGALQSARPPSKGGALSTAVHRRLSGGPQPGGAWAGAPRPQHLQEKRNHAAKL